MTDGTLRILRGVDPDCGTSRSRMQRKGLRKGWLRNVTGTNPKGKGGYQFDGEFVDPGDELYIGSVVVNKTPENGYRAGIVVPRSAEKGDPNTEGTVRWTVEGVDTAVARRECERLLAMSEGDRLSDTTTDKAPPDPLVDRLRDTLDRRTRGKLDTTDAKLLVRDLLREYPDAWPAS